MENENKSLVEVWKWKEEIYAEVKDLDTREYLEKLRKDAEKFLLSNGISLAAVSLVEKKL